MRTFACILMGVVMCVGCEDETIVAGPGANPPTAPSASPKPPAAATDASVSKGEPPQFRDEDFVEVEARNRDPFRSFASLFKVSAVQAPQRRVLLPTTSVDEMRLIAIVSGVAQPRAMLTDPNNVGHVVKSGDYIGRPEVIQTGGSESMPVTLNWRVDRIRPGELVLTREDPTAPNRPPLNRVIPLREK